VQVLNFVGFFYVYLTNPKPFKAILTKQLSKYRNKQMPDVFTEDKTFEKSELLSKGEYENCIFNNCNFTDFDLSEYQFIDCTFNDCNLSMVKTNKTAFRNTNFNNCKMLGVRFDTCNEIGLSFSFDSCQLNHSSFYKSKIKKSVFKNSQLKEIDFAETDLTGVVFDNCNLLQAVFDHTILEKTDFRTSYDYSIDPDINRIKKAKFSILGVSGLLDKYDIEIEM